MDNTETMKLISKLKDKIKRNFAFWEVYSGSLKSVDLDKIYIIYAYSPNDFEIMQRELKLLSKQETYEKIKKMGINEHMTSFDLLLSQNAFFEEALTVKEIGDNSDFYKTKTFYSGLSEWEKDSIGFFLKEENDISSYIIINDIILVQASPVIENKRDGRLHNLKGPAQVYKDGYKTYYIEGVRFTPEQFKAIISKEIAPKTIFALNNTEQRSAILRTIPDIFIKDAEIKDIYEVHKKVPYVEVNNKKMVLALKYARHGDIFFESELSDKEIIAKAYDAGYKINFEDRLEIYKLYRYKSGFRNDLYILEKICPSTQRKFYEYIPRKNANNCIEALSYQLGIDKSQYELVVSET